MLALSKFTPERIGGVLRCGPSRVMNSARIQLRDVSAIELKVLYGLYGHTLSQIPRNVLVYILIKI
jgi:hypothetical protein